MDSVEATGRFGNPRRVYRSAAKLLAAFVLGALSALLPAYYYLARDAPRDEPVISGAPSTLARQIQAAADAPPPAAAWRFASRMSFELQSLVAEDAPARREPPPSPAPTRNASSSAAQGGAPAAAPERVANARPIVPAGGGAKPEDGTERRAPPQDTAPRAPAPRPRVIEGRDVQLKSRPAEDR